MHIYIYIWLHIHLCICLCTSICIRIDSPILHMSEVFHACFPVLNTLIIEYYGWFNGITVV